MLISDPTFDLTTPGIESVNAMYAQPLKGKNLKGLCLVCGWLIQMLQTCSTYNRNMSASIDAVSSEVKLMDSISLNAPHMSQLCVGYSIGKVFHKRVFPYMTDFQRKSLQVDRPGEE